MSMSSTTKHLSSKDLKYNFEIKKIYLKHRIM